MKARPASLPSENVERPLHEVRKPDLGPALKRDLVLQRVRAARKRLSPGPSSPLARLR